VTFQRSYNDEQLRAAVASQHSWRGVLRALGLTATSAGSQRSVRRHADRLELDYSHFTGQRRWTDAALAQAVAESYSWAQVAATLGIKGGSSYPLLRGHALRLGLDISHFGRQLVRPAPKRTVRPNVSNLRYAGPLLAAAWFALCDYEVSWPLEPYRYDLLVRQSERIERVQVKTTTRRGTNSWPVDLGPGGKGSAYDPDDLDSFFIITAGLDCYYIPIKAVAGRGSINLSFYSEYWVAQAPVIPREWPIASGS